MKTINFTAPIKATAAKVWQVLWNDETYRQWTSPFMEGSYAVTDWKEGSPILFLSPKGEGMYSVITESKPNAVMTFKHLGVIKNFIEQPNDEETKTWSGAMETYSLKEENGITTLSVAMNTIEQFQEYFDATFPKAMGLIKELSEKPISIVVEASVAAPVEKVWKLWTGPEHITKWNNASPDWHTPKAENDLRNGGKFRARMEAKDGSSGFDFEGVYDEVKANTLIAYTLGDGRKVKIEFKGNGNTTRVVESFDAETENTLELQRGGWQAILNNFKNYSETVV